MKLLNLFKTAPKAPPIAPHLVASTYKYWRMNILATTFIGYAAFYFTRGTLTLTLPELKQLGFDEVKLGMIITIFQICYGTSKFFGGIMADNSNPRMLMSIGLIASGLFNIFFGLSSSLALFAVFWLMNGLFQAWGAPPCHRLLTHWFSRSEKGRFWGFWNTSHNAGAALLPIIAVFFITRYGWRAGMIAPGAFSVVVGFILLWRLRDIPETLGLPPIEEFKKELGQKEELKVAKKRNFKAKKEKELTPKEILFKYVLTNKYIWMLAVSCFLIYMVRWSFSQWIYFFLVDGHGMQKTLAAQSIFWFEVGGFAGSLVAGTLSDVVFKGKRGPVNVIFSLAVIPLVFGLWNYTKMGTMSAPIVFTFLAFIGFFIFGPQMLIAVAATELSHKKSAATAVGFLSIISYIGCSFTGGPLGYIIRDYGWNAFFAIILVSGTLASLLLMPLWNVTRRDDEEEEIEEDLLDGNLEPVIHEIHSEENTAS